MEIISTLVVLALVDSTSFGTLVIPVWMLLYSKFRTKRLLIYLIFLAVFYWIVGLLLLLFLQPITSLWNATENLTSIAYGQIVVGAVLIIASSVVDGSESFMKKATDWKTKIHKQEGGVKPLAQLALGAGLFEVGTMLPYLAAIGIILKQSDPYTIQAATLAAYIFVMILPALVLTLIRAYMRRRSVTFLEHVDTWLTKNAGELVKTLFVVIGLLLALDGLKQLNIYPFN